MDIEEIARRARKHLGDFCINGCRSYCCRKGYLVIEADEIDTVVKDRKKYQHLIKKLDNGKYSLYMGTSDIGCPSLRKDFKCSIHKNAKRPKVCDDFPLFLKGKDVYLSYRCLAVRQGILYPYIKRLQLKGCNIHYQDKLDMSDVLEHI